VTRDEALSKVVRAARVYRDATRNMSLCDEEEISEAAEQLDKALNDLDDRAVAALESGHL